MGQRSLRRIVAVEKITRTPLDPLESRRALLAWPANAPEISTTKSHWACRTDTNRCPSAVTHRWTTP